MVIFAANHLYPYREHTMKYNYLTRFLLVFVVSILTLTTANAQEEPCGFDEAHSHMMDKDPTYMDRVQQFNREFSKYITEKPRSRTGEKAPVVTIPLVFHIIHRGEPVGEGSNITDEQVISAVDGMNIQFRNMNEDGSIYDPEGTDLEFEFCLAQRDPDGNPTNGINRVDGSSVPFYADEGIYSRGAKENEEEVKALSRWDNTEYYNIWVVAQIDNQEPFGSGTKGYAYFPGANSRVDGTVVLFNYTGYDPDGSRGLRGNGQLTNGTADNNGTMVHEVGHAFALYHTFEGADPNGGNCPPAESNCSNDGDRVCDLPPHDSHLGDCKSPDDINSCTGNPYGNVIRNYMNYTNCSPLIFSEGQRDRVRFALENQRSYFNVTGTPESCVPVFEYDIAIKNLFKPEGFYCNGNVEGDILVKNNGQLPIDSFAIEYGVDGVVDSVFTYRGLLESQDEVQITLPGVQTSTGPHQFFAQVKANGINDNRADEFQNNDFQESNFEVINGSPVRVTINNYEDADRFEFIDSEGNVAVSFDMANLSGEFDQEFCLPSDKCYTFHYYDAVFIHPQVGGTPPEYELISVNNGYLIDDGIFPYPGFTGGPYEDVTEEFCMPFDPGFVTANFDVSQRVVEVGQPVNFFDRSQSSTGDPASSWSWDFGDGQSSSQQNPNHTYLTPGVYTVSLTANNGLEPNTLEKIQLIRVLNTVTGCDEFNNLIGSEQPTSYSTVNGEPGNFPGNNTLGVSEYAERFFATEKNKLVYVDLFIRSINASNPANLLNINVYTGSLSGGQPASKIKSVHVPISELQENSRNRIEFEDFPEVDKFYFIGYTTEDPSDEVIVGTAPYRGENNFSNTAFAKVGGAWTSVDTLFEESSATSLNITTATSYVPQPVAYATVNTICAGQSFDVIGELSKRTNNFLWKFGPNANRETSSAANTSVTFFEGGEYDIYLVTTGGCNIKDSALVEVSVDSIPEVEMVLTDDVCSQENGTAFAKMTGGSGNFTFEWSFNPGFKGNKHTGAAAGFYTYTWSDPACGVQDRVESYEILDKSVVPEFDLSSKQTTCGQDDGRASILDDGLLPYNYKWTKRQDSTFVRTSKTILQLNPGTYIAELSYAGCSSRIDSVEILPSEEVTGEVASIPEVCPNTPVKLWATGGDSLKWFDDQNRVFANNVDTVVIDTTNTAKFTVVFYGDTGCTLEKITGVDIQSRARAQAKVSNGTSDYSDTVRVDLVDGATALFSSAGTFARSFEWNFGDSTLSTERNPAHSYTKEGTYEVILFAYNNGCDDSDTNIVMVTDTTGIVGFEPENNQQSFHIYPNPANTQVTIAASNTVASASVVLMDVTGKTVFQDTSKSWDEISIPLDRLNTGIYFLNVKTPIGEYQTKISVVH